MFLFIGTIMILVQGLACIHAHTELIVNNSYIICIFIVNNSYIICIFIVNNGYIICIFRWLCTQKTGWIREEDINASQSIVVLYM